MSWAMDPLKSFRGHSGTITGQVPDVFEANPGVWLIVYGRQRPLFVRRDPAEATLTGE